MKELIGKKVLRVIVAKDKERLEFACEGGDRVQYRCDGDCCSSTWIEHIQGVDALLGQTVEGVDSTEAVTDAEDKRDECVQVYGYTLRTAKGRCHIEFRNGSNGYYGGSLEHVTTPEKMPYASLTEDF